MSFFLSLCSQDYTLVEVIPKAGTDVVFDGTSLLAERTGQAENMFLLNAMDTLQLQSAVG